MVLKVEIREFGNLLTYFIPCLAIAIAGSYVDPKSVAQKSKEKDDDDAHSNVSALSSTISSVSWASSASAFNPGIPIVAPVGYGKLG